MGGKGFAKWTSLSKFVYNQSDFECVSCTYRQIDGYFGQWSSNNLR